MQAVNVCLIAHVTHTWHASCLPRNHLRKKPPKGEAIRPTQLPQTPSARRPTPVHFWRNLSFLSTPFPSHTLPSPFLMSVPVQSIAFRVQILTFTSSLRGCRALALARSHPAAPCSWHPWTDKHPQLLLRVW